ncbi:hypothetical protein LTR85_001554 [Meristemomyces frigidus]|nr:hypothetical protein LTR85_001554 [Meristemomyces frigidus]
MADPVTLASIAAINSGCDFAVGTLPQFFPLVHDEMTRKRLFRLGILLERVLDGTLPAKDLAEAHFLLAKIRSNGLMKENASILAYVSEVAVLLHVIHKSSEAKDETIVSVEDVPPTPLSKLDSDVELSSSSASVKLAESASGFFGDAARDTTVPAATVPTSSSTSSELSSSLHSEDEKLDPIPEHMAHARKLKTHPKLKKAACWTLVLTAGPVTLLAPQVRRNL